MLLCYAKLIFFEFMVQRIHNGDIMVCKNIVIWQKTYILFYPLCFSQSQWSPKICTVYSQGSSK